MARTDKTRINLYLPNKVIEALDKEAEEKGTSRTSVLLNIIDNYTKQYEILATMKDMIDFAKLNKK